MTRWAPWLAVAAAGVITGVSSAPRDLPALAYLGFAALVWTFAREMESAPLHRAWRRGLAMGFVFGAAVNAVALRFMVGLLIEFGHMPIPVAVLVSLLAWSAQALVHAFAGCIVGALSERASAEKTGVLACLVWPVALVVTEHLTPMLFPWRLAAALAPWVPMIQLAELGGEPIVTLVLAGASAGAAAWGFARTRSLRIATAAMAIGCLLVPFVYGLWAEHRVDVQRSRAERFRVGLVQPNVPIGEKGDDGLAFEQFDRIADMTRVLSDRDADVVVWPETAAPFAMRRTMRREPEGPWSMLDRGVTSPVLMGVVTWHSIARKHNSAILLRPDGTYSRPTDKLELIPFSEETPFWQPTVTLVRALWPTAPFRPWLERAKGFTPGDEPVLIEVPYGRHVLPARLGVMICYEDIFPAIGRRVFHARGGPPQLLVNMTNDAWFGDGDEPHMHLALSRFRAVETRRDLVRAVNTGVSAAITATGEVTSRTGTFVPATVMADARLLHGTTVYMALGDWVVSFAFALIVALAVRRSTARLGAGRVA